MFNRSHAVAATLLLASSGVLSAEAQSGGTIPNTIFVRFQLRVPEATLTFPDPTAAEKELSKNFATSLSNEFPWTFEQGNGSVFPRLDIWLDEQGQEWDVHLTLTAKNGAPPKPFDTVVLWPPGALAALGGLPLPNQWFKVLSTVLENALFVPKRLAVVNVLKAIPLGVNITGKEVVMIENPPTSAAMARSVLPLDWNRYEFLANSEFSIQCARQNGGDPVWLRSKGIGAKFDYKPGNRQFDGVLIRHLKWMSGGTEDEVGNHLPDFVQLIPEAFYLDDLNESPNPLLSQAP